MFEIETPTGQLIFSIILLVAGLLLIYFLDKHYSNNDLRLNEINRMIRNYEDLSMDSHHTLFHSYYRKEPIGCFFITGLLIFGGIAGIIASIGWYLYQFVVSN
jgi:hypothetical protein